MIEVVKKIDGKEEDETYLMEICIKSWISKIHINRKFYIIKSNDNNKIFIAQIINYYFFK